MADIQPAILDRFGHVELLPWIGVAFALGTMTILPWTKAYGIFNIKWLYIFNIFLFEVGSAICGAAPNMTALIIARVIAGVGGCGMHAGSLMYIAVLTSMKERRLYMSGIAVLWGLGSVLGPVVWIQLSIGHDHQFRARSYFLLGRWCARHQQRNVALGMFTISIYTHFVPS